MNIGPETRCNEKDYVYAAKPGVTRSCDEYPDLSLAADTESKGGKERIAEAWRTKRKIRNMPKGKGSQSSWQG